LLEAEGRSLRRSIARLGQSLGLLAVCIILATGGVGLLLWALYQSMVVALGSALSALITGLAALFAAGVISWIAYLIAR
jgi:hypothetical protein